MHDPLDRRKCFMLMKIEQHIGPPPPLEFKPMTAITLHTHFAYPQQRVSSLQSCHNAITCCNCDHLPQTRSPAFNIFSPRIAISTPSPHRTDQRLIIALATKSDRTTGRDSFSGRCVASGILPVGPVDVPCLEPRLHAAAR
jgi:hypothetical protein